MIHSLARIHCNTDAIIQNSIRNPTKQQNSKQGDLLRSWREHLFAPSRVPVKLCDVSLFEHVSIHRYFREYAIFDVVGKVLPS